MESSSSLSRLGLLLTRLFCCKIMERVMDPTRTILTHSQIFSRSPRQLCVAGLDSSLRRLLPNLVQCKKVDVCTDELFDYYDSSVLPIYSFRQGSYVSYKSPRALLRFAVHRNEYFRQDANT